jgi:hypothetical protein
MERANACQVNLNREDTGAQDSGMPSAHITASAAQHGVRGGIMKLTYHDIWLISNRICDAYNIGRSDEPTQLELRAPQPARIVCIGDNRMQAKAA